MQQTESRLLFMELASMTWSSVTLLQVRARPIDQGIVVFAVPEELLTLCQLLI